ncbi:MAG: ribbon-helix-helix protein, CopG family [Anaerolineae bacterium]|nr:ribbon-helix-helix protein, CopG family [Anaerolineae bacterium]
MSNKRVVISIPKSFLEIVDRVAEEEHRSRSEFFREAARLYHRVGASRGQPICDPGICQAVDLMEETAHQDRRGKTELQSMSCVPSGNGPVAETPLSGSIVPDTSVVLKSYSKSKNLPVGQRRG